MRCPEVIRELTTPTEAADRAAVERHLAACPACSAEASASRRLDQLWALSRPTIPAESTWQALWSRVEAQADAPPTVPSLIDPGRPRRARWAAVWAVAAIAQAAALLLAARLLLDRPAQTGTPAVGEALAAAPPAPAPVPVDFELKEGQTLFLVLDESGDRLVVKPDVLDTADLVAYDGEDHDPFAFDAAAQSGMIVLNALEGLE